jgi:hypothetical protein
MTLKLDFTGTRGDGQALSVSQQNCRHTRVKISSRYDSCLKKKIHCCLMIYRFGLRQSVDVNLVIGTKMEKYPPLDIKRYNDNSTFLQSNIYFIKQKLPTKEYQQKQI